VLSAGTIQWIKRLKGEGLSQRQISEATGAARNTISEVLGLDRIAEELYDTLYDVEDPIFTDPPRRCEGCGAVVYQPCLACGLRAVASRGKKEPTSGGADPRMKV
jgi:hypothetical protein